MPAISSYLFVHLSSREDTALTLSDDTAVEVVLSDIPFFSVGLVAFAVSTFFLVMKRVTLLSIYLYASALLAFASAILDLSQMLARGPENVSANLALDTVTGLINTREVGFALSLGLRLLYYWGFVAERPRGEPLPSLPINGQYNAREHSHSASWQRWGYLGFLLKWGLLALLFSVPVLQIIWRIALRRVGTIYMVEATIEIAVSGLFILKIMLNVFLSPRNPWWRPFSSNLAPLLALLLSLGVAIGNLIFFMFSETTLGRFLQAIELYILILFTLISAFYKGPQPTAAPSRSRRSRVTSSFAGLGEKNRESAYPQALFDRKSQNPATYLGDPFGPAPPRPPRESGASLSSWVLARPPGPSVSRRPKSEDPEPTSDPTSDEVQQVRNVEPTVSSEAKGNAVLNAKESSDKVVPTEDIPPRSRSYPDTLPPSRSPGLPDEGLAIRPTTGATISSYYGTNRGSRLSYPNPAFNSSGTRGGGSDSPIYGLNGIIRRTPNRSSTNSSIRPAGNSLFSFDELLRQQTELDKSIAALRLFSPRPSMAISAESPPTTPKILFDDLPSRPPLRSVSTSSNSNTDQRVESSSNRSEFSLSIFPEPPAPDTTSLLTASNAGAPMRSHQQSKSSFSPFKFPSEDTPSLPSSPNRDVVPTRFGSNGTQYDVTSFIGDLSGPIRGHRPLSSFNSRTGLGLSDVESEDEGTPTIVTRAIPPVVAETSEVVTTTPSDTVITSDDRPTSPRDPSFNNTPYLRDSLQPMLRPLLLGNVTTSAPAVSSPLSQAYTATRNSTLIPIGPRRPLRGPNSTVSRVQFTISRPRQEEHAPGSAFEYERPRPPPLLFRQSEKNKEEKEDGAQV